LSEAKDFIGRHIFSKEKKHGNSEPFHQLHLLQRSCAAILQDGKACLCLLNGVFLAGDAATENSVLDSFSYSGNSFTPQLQFLCGKFYCIHQRMSHTASSSRRATLNGLAFYFEIHGSGKPLLLLHGGGSTIETSFGKLLPLLAAHRQVIAIELQGHGHTADRDTPESFVQDAADAAALLQYIACEKADVLGFSNGGQTALQMGISYPHLVNKLIIISAFYKREGTPAGFFDGFPQASLQDMPAVYKEAYMGIDGNSEVGLLRMFEQDKNRMMRFEGWTDVQMASITAPAFIIAGDRDVATPAHLAEMQRVIPNARLMILPGGHGDFIGEAMTPQADMQTLTFVAAEIEKFLDCG
jgi:pimeloyl-ACP methyl ester carboxylesterase